MNGTDNNLLALLHKWAPQQDENFTTESFAHMLRHLLASEPVVGVHLANRLAGEDFFAADDAVTIDVNTQVTTDQGRPDIEIRSLDAIVLVEAKVESGLSGDQLRRYREYLDADPADRKALVLLTRYPLEPDDGDGQPDVSWRWYHVADWLNNLLEDNTLRRRESRYLVRQFAGFLEARGMTIERVSYELKAGVRSLVSLIDMLAEIIDSLGEWRKASPEKNYYGHYVRHRQGWVGVKFDDPALLLFQSHKIPVDPSVAETLDGIVEKASTRYYPSGYRWQIEVPLDSEEVHFFSRSRASQMQALEAFVRKGLDGLTQLSPPVE